MNENELLYSGAIRFSDKYNIGVYIHEDENGDPVIYITNENTGDTIYGPLG